MKRNFCKFIGILSFILIGTAFPLIAQEKFNKKPLQTFGAELSEKIGKNVDLTRPFSVTITGVLTKDGKLDPQKTSLAKSEGDVEIINIAKNAVGAISDSGLFSYFAGMGLEKIQADVLQNETDLSASIKSELLNEARTRTVAGSLNMVFQLAKINALDSDVKFLLNGVKTMSDGKYLTINFNLPKEETHRIIRQKLERSSGETGN